MEERVMDRMFVTLENSIIDLADSYDGPEPMRSKAAKASYLCKLYRAHLGQGAESNTPLFATQFKAAAQLLRA